MALIASTSTTTAASAASIAAAAAADTADLGSIPDRDKVSGGGGRGGGGGGTASITCEAGIEFEIVEVTVTEATVAICFEKIITQALAKSQSDL